MPADQIIRLVIDASIVVQLVLALLLIASIGSWSVIPVQARSAGQIKQ